MSDSEPLVIARTVTQADPTTVQLVDIDGVQPHDTPHEAMPTPTPEELKDPLFDAIYETIKKWDVNVPQCYNGYCAANGSHAVMILRAVRAKFAPGSFIWGEKVVWPETIGIPESFPPGGGLDHDHDHQEPPAQQ